MIFVAVCGTEDETQAFGFSVGQRIQRPVIITLQGTLGAGKTAFVRGLAAGLGFAGNVSSPTFAIVNEYTGGRFKVLHFDLYRLQTQEDLWGIGFDDYLDQSAVMVLEWPLIALALLPKERVNITIDICGESTRKFTVVDDFSQLV